MDTLLTHKTASLTDLRDPKKVLEKAGNQPVAILNRSHLEGYYVPASAVDKLSYEPVATQDVLSALKSRKNVLDPTLDYLKDK